MHCKIHSSIAEISPKLWDRLFDSENPFVQHAFLLAMEDSGCVNAATGWQPRHLNLMVNDEPLAPMPLFEKTDS